MAKKSRGNRKTWEITYPNGEKIITGNFKEWSTENKISSKKLPSMEKLIKDILVKLFPKIKKTQYFLGLKN